MVQVVSGLDLEGKPCKFYIDYRIKEMCDLAKKRNKKDHDYVAIVGGIPGTGKSTFCRTIGKYLDPTFDETHYCFTADEFIKKTNELPPYSTIILDESFATFARRAGASADLFRILNHLNLIRMKRLFIFLCLPNFFDLPASISIFRSSHLFLTYSQNTGARGYFKAYDRNAKRILYVRGKRDMDYNASQANFRGRYAKAEHIFSEEAYNEMKLANLQKQEDLSKHIDRPITENELRAIYALRCWFVEKQREGKIVFSKTAKELGFGPSVFGNWVKNYDKYKKLAQTKERKLKGVI